MLQGRVAQLFFSGANNPIYVCYTVLRIFSVIIHFLQFIPLLARARSLITLARESTLKKKKISKKESLQRNRGELKLHSRRTMNITDDVWTDSQYG